MSDNANVRQTVVDYAMAQIGKEYSLGAAGPDKFDCSGLTMRAWQAGGFSLPHFTVAQYAACKQVPISEAEPGDLVWFGGYNAANEPHHVGVFLAQGKMVDAPDYGIPVGIHDYNTYGDVMATVGRLPIEGTSTVTVADYSPTTTTGESTMSVVSSTSSILGGVSTIAKNLLNANFWKKLGLGAMGIVVLIFMAKWIS